MENNVQTWEIRSYEGFVETQLVFINDILKSPDYKDYRISHKEILRFIDKDQLLTQVDSDGRMRGLHYSDPDSLILLLTDIYTSFRCSDWHLYYHKSEIEIASRMLFIILNNPYYLAQRETNLLSPSLVSRRHEYSSSYYKYPYLVRNSPEMLMRGFNMILEELSKDDSKICPMGEHLLKVNNISYQTDLSPTGIVPNCKVESGFVLTDNKYVISHELSGYRGLDALRLFRQIRKQEIPGGRASSYSEQSFMNDFQKPLLNILNDSILELFIFSTIYNNLNNGSLLALNILKLFYNGDELDYLSDQEFEELQFRMKNEISRIKKFELGTNIEEILSYTVFSFIDTYISYYNSEKLSELGRSRLKSTILEIFDMAYGDINSEEIIEYKALLSKVIDDSHDYPQNQRLQNMLVALQKSKFGSEPQRYSPEIN